MFYQNDTPQRAGRVLYYLVYGSINPREHSFSMHFTYYTSQFFLNNHRIPFGKLPNGAMDGPILYLSNLGEQELA